MSVAQLVEALGHGAPFGLLGGLIGAVYFTMLRLNVDRYLSGGSLGPALLMHLGRLLLAGTGFALIAPSGALPLLAALLGFQLARSLTLRVQRLSS